jgi:hypothetical protein
MFGSFSRALLVGFSTTNFTRAWEPTLSWDQFHKCALFLRLFPHQLSEMAFAPSMTFPVVQSAQVGQVLEPSAQGVQT